MSTPRSAGQHAGLTHEQVLEEARTIADQDGIDGLTMRALAKRLGVMPNALYTYFPNKQGLLDALLDSLLGDIDVAGVEEMDWRTGLTRIMDESRRLLLSHPQLIPQFLSRPGLGPNATRLGEASFALLRKAGFEGQRAVNGFQVLLIFSLGFAAFQAERLDENRTRQAEAVFMELPEDGFPEMRELAPFVAAHPSEESFFMGLNWLIEGIAGSDML